MEELDYWRLCEELNIVQASLLGITLSCWLVLRVYEIGVTSWPRLSYKSF